MHQLLSKTKTKKKLFLSSQTAVVILKDQLKLDTLFGNFTNLKTETSVWYC